MLIIFPEEISQHPDLRAATENFIELVVALKDSTIKLICLQEQEDSIVYTGWGHEIC